MTTLPRRPSGAQTASLGRFIAILRLAIVPVLVGTAAFVAWRLGYFQLDKRQELAAFARRIHALRWSEVAYVAVYATAIAAVLPASLMTLLGGALFGAWEGALLAWAGAMAGTCLTHTLARRVLRAPLQRLMGEHRVLRRLRERADILALFRLRILPIAPFATLDYLAGLAAVPLRRLLAATTVGILPSVLAYAYVGAALIRGGVSRDGESTRALWIAGGVTALMLLLSAMPMLLQRMRD